MAKVIDNYIFDFDGTLMDTSAVILSSLQATIAQMHLPARTEEQCRAVIGIRTDEAGRFLYPELDISNAEFARNFRQCYARIQDGRREQPFPGVTDTLRKLHSQGHGLAIASSRRLDSLNNYLEAMGISPLLSMVVGADSVTKGKPDPEPVLTILEALGWQPTTTLVVGDADVDIMMGNAAGCLTCAVSYGNGSPQSLRAAAPTFTIDSFATILAL